LNVDGCTWDAIAGELNRQEIRPPTASSWSLVNTSKIARRAALVLDIYSRRIVGFALGQHHDTALAYAALAYAAFAMAECVRGGAVDGVVLHTDGGSNTPHGPSRLPAPDLGQPVDGPARVGARQTPRSSPGTPP